jgi:ATP-dependent protease HslVU (ClpYQ) ATPase subunit
MSDLTPREIVSELDRFIIGQRREESRRRRTPKPLAPEATQR